MERARDKIVTYGSSHIAYCLWHGALLCIACWLLSGWLHFRRLPKQRRIVWHRRRQPKPRSLRLKLPQPRRPASRLVCICMVWYASVRIHFLRSTACHTCLTGDKLPFHVGTLQFWGRASITERSEVVIKSPGLVAKIIPWPI